MASGSLSTIWRERSVHELHTEGQQRPDHLRPNRPWRAAVGDGARPGLVSLAGHQPEQPAGLSTVFQKDKKILESMKDEPEKTTGSFIHSWEILTAQARSSHSTSVH
jgi:hypothetical protein